MRANISACAQPGNRARLTPLAVYGVLRISDAHPPWDDRRGMEKVMATKVSRSAGSAPAHLLGYRRLGLSGGLTALVLFVACWAAAQIPAFSPTHAYIGLFTKAEMASRTALVEGGAWSLIFGAFASALFALIYNLTAPLARR